LVSFSTSYVLVAISASLNVVRWYRVLSPRVDIKVDNVGQFGMFST
jgi:hypothetical protein